MRYVIYCGPGIGDLILILPMVREIKKVDRNAYVMVIMTSDSKRILTSKSMLKIQDYIDEIDYYSLHEPLQCLKLISKMGIKKYDYGFVLQYTDKKTTSQWPNKIVGLAAKKTCGIRSSYHSKVKYSCEINREVGMRIIDYPKIMLQKMKISDCEKYDSTKGLINREKLIKEYGELGLELSGRKVISIVVGTAKVSGKIEKKYVSNSPKNWEYKLWIELGQRLSNAGYDVLLLGGKKEEEELKQSNLLLETNQINNLSGKYNILQSMAVLMMSDIVVGADTGLMHCAGALDIPSLTLFGCTDYKEYLPMGNKAHYISAEVECSPCFGTQKSLICKEMACMRSIHVDYVYKKIEEILECN